jgi:hypothetical protein
VSQSPNCQSPRSAHDADRSYLEKVDGIFPSSPLTRIPSALPNRPPQTCPLNLIPLHQSPLSISPLHCPHLSPPSAPVPPFHAPFYVTLTQKAPLFLNNRSHLPSISDQTIVGSSQKTILRRSQWYRLFFLFFLALSPSLTPPQSVSGQIPATAGERRTFS